jgi:hypothetical protein
MTEFKLHLFRKVQVYENTKGQSYIEYRGDVRKNEGKTEGL